MNEMAIGMNSVYYMVSSSYEVSGNQNFIVNSMTRTMTYQTFVPAYYGQYFSYHTNMEYGNLYSPPQPTTHGPPQPTAHGPPQPTAHRPSQSIVHRPPQPTTYSSPQPTVHSPTQPTAQSPPRGSRDTLKQCKYYCHECNSLSFKKNDFVHHVLSPSHLSAFQGECFSYFCRICNMTIYGLLPNIILHSVSVHGQPLARLPELCILQSRILQHYETNTTDEIMFACVHCRQFGPMDSTNNSYQDHCSSCQMMTPYFCPICNVTISCPSYTFEMHNHSFEHIYIGWKRFGLQ